MSSREKFKSVDYQILESIITRGSGSIFVPTDFLDLGSREAIDIVLHRLVRKGTIRRLARGIYDYPEEHPVIGKLQPSPEKIAEALVDRDCTRIQATGAYAANMLGLSEQVPAKVVFLTDGPSSNDKGRRNNHSAPANNTQKYGDDGSVQWAFGSGSPRTRERKCDRRAA